MHGIAEIKRMNRDPEAYARNRDDHDEASNRGRVIANRIEREAKAANDKVRKAR